jgi:hypothetical protein
MTQAFVSSSQSTGSLAPFVALTNTVTCNVVFGTPSPDDDCMNSGICKIVVAALPHPGQSAAVRRRCQQSTAQASIDSDGSFQLFFAKADLKPCTERAIFRNLWFPVPVAYQMPDELLSALGKDNSGVIAAGKYLIERQPTGYIVRF